MNIDKNINNEKEINTENNIHLKNNLIEELQLENKKLNKQYNDLLLRSQADIDNIKKRSKLEIEKNNKFSLEKFSFDLLTIIDNLERGMDVTSNKNLKINTLIDGIKLTIKSFMEIIRNHGINIINTNNIKFDPEIHEAMKVVKNSKYKDNYVIEIIQKGYMLNGRLLRPAMVIVSKNN